MHATQDSSGYEHPPKPPKKKSRAEYNRQLRLRIQAERKALRDIRAILDRLGVEAS